MAVLLWTKMGITAFLQSIKPLCCGSMPNLDALIVLAAAIATITATLIWGKTRIGAGYIWLAVGGLGLIFLVTGAGLEIEWMLDKSLALLFIGLISARFLLTGLK